jgi:PTS system N-acetylgalactosamine-specific IIC component
MIGYVLFAYLGMPTMAIAITAGAIALIVFFNQGKGAVAAEEEEVVFEDGI